MAGMGISERSLPTSYPIQPLTDDQEHQVVDQTEAPSISTVETDISPEDALQIATAYAGSGTVHTIELKLEHGFRVYEVTFVNGGKVYVDARMGQVVYAKLRKNE